MSEASQRSRVTMTLGRSGQVIKRAESELDDGGTSYELPRVGIKRSVKERLGIRIDTSSLQGSEIINKRQRREASFSGNGDFMGTSRGLSPPRNGGDFMCGSRVLSPTRNPRSYMTSRVLSPPRNIENFHGQPLRRVFETVKGVSNAQSPVSSAPPYMARMPLLPSTTKAPQPALLGQILPSGITVQNTPFTLEEHQTVESLLNSLGLGKYAIHFKAEEVDMSALKQMKESDLKDLSIPMGPRKKILQALTQRPKRP